MSSYSKFGIPDDFEEILTELKQRTLKWQTLYHSGTKINSQATISFHSALTDKPFGNLVLVPGLATNSKIDPLTKSITYWGLTHQYNVFTIDTILGDFETNVNQDNAYKYTFDEVKNILHQTFRFITPYTNQKACITGHCISTILITAIFNDYVKNNQQNPFHSAIFFAPWPEITKQKYTAMEAYYKILQNQPKPWGDITKAKIQHLKYVLSLYKLRHLDIQQQFEPEIMNKWQIPVTFVAANRDNIAPASHINTNVDILRSLPNGKYFNYLRFPNATHTFHNAYQDTDSVLQLIKSQRKKIR